MELRDEQKALFRACIDLVGRTGATGFECGHLHDDVPVEEAAWYAQASYRGTRVIEENHADPLDAAYALAIRLLTGGRCKCGKVATLDPDAAFVYFHATLLGGEKWDAVKSSQVGQCHWNFDGKRFNPGCE